MSRLEKERSFYDRCGLYCRYNHHYKLSFTDSISPKANILLFLTYCTVFPNTRWYKSKQQRMKFDFIPYKFQISCKGNIF